MRIAIPCLLNQFIADGPLIEQLGLDCKDGRSRSLNVGHGLLKKVGVDHLFEVLLKVKHAISLTFGR